MDIENKQVKNVIIIGAGGHAAEIDDYIYFAINNRNVKDINVIGFIDDNAENYSQYSFTAPLLGTIKDHQVRKDVNYIIGIANLKYRKLFVEHFVAQGANFLTFIHPDSYISASCKIGKGVVVAPNVNIGPKAEIGDYTLLNSRCSIGHDTKLGKFNFISPNVCFSGFTEVGNENLFGINSATIPSIKIGDRNKIMAGMTIDKNVNDDEVVFYRFKERLIVSSK